MRINVLNGTIHGVFGLVLAGLGVNATPAVAADTPSAAPQLCVQVDGRPSDRCIAVEAVSMQLDAAGEDGTSTSGAGELSIVVELVEMDRLMALMAVETDAKICIVNGANICPPQTV